MMIQAAQLTVLILDGYCGMYWDIQQAFEMPRTAEHELPHCTEYCL